MSKRLKDKNELHCPLCGVKYSERPMNNYAYDQKTGEPLIETYCSNVECREGCEEGGGHYFKRKLLKDIKVCSGCGEIKNTNFLLPFIVWTFYFIVLVVIIILNS